MEKIYLVDGTYELFRSFYGPPLRKSPDGREVGATIGLLRSLLALVSNSDVTHIACAFDHVIESFRNDLFQGYKTGAGIDPDLFAQFPLAEDEATVIEKYGVPPSSIPDWLALVGDSADGIPGIPTWGAKSASELLSRYQHIEAIPDDTSQWGISAGRARRLAENLAAHREQARLYLRLTRLRTDVPLAEKASDLEWRGAHEGFIKLCLELGANNLPDQIPRWISD
jgi:5'-3' exonuclease